MSSLKGGVLPASGSELQKADFRSLKNNQQAQKGDNQMLVQQSLFDVYSESGEDQVSEREALKASQDEKKDIATRAPSRSHQQPHWKLVDSVWQKIIFFAHLYAGLGKLIDTLGSTSEAWRAQNPMWMTGSMAAITIVVVLVAQNIVPLRKLYRLAINVIEKRKGMIQR
jgi:uncharacterized membrane protein YcjF (UPF0283 family)